MFPNCDLCESGIKHVHRRPMGVPTLKRYQVTATRFVSRNPNDRWLGVTQVPTFQINAISEEHAQRIAEDIVGPLNCCVDVAEV